MNPAHSAALRLLARRELSVRQLRERLLDRGHPSEQVEDAIARLLERGLLDDRRVAAAYVRTAIAIKGRGPLRIQRELERLGIARDLAAEATAASEQDARTAIDRALQRKLRGAPLPAAREERARLYRYLLRQGFSSPAIAAALGRPAHDDD